MRNLFSGFPERISCLCRNTLDKNNHMQSAGSRVRGHVLEDLLPLVLDLGLGPLGRKSGNETVEED